MQKSIKVWLYNKMSQNPQSGNLRKFLFYVILTISYLQVWTIEMSSLPNDSMQPLFKQIKIFLANATSKISETPIPHLWLVMLAYNIVSFPHVCLSQACTVQDRIDLTPKHLYNTNSIQNVTQKKRKRNAKNLCEWERVPCQKKASLKVQIWDLL